MRSKCNSFRFPTLDHVVVNTRDLLDQAAEQYRRLGFTLTPRGYHTLGSMNHLAIFGTEYLELIAARSGYRGRAEILDAPAGLNGVVFGMEDSAATYQALDSAGVPVEPPNEFARPVELPTGTRDAVFRTVRLKPGTVPAGRLYFCHHFTRDLVWRDEWWHHPNGVIGVERIVFVAEYPQDIADVFARMFGPEALRGGALAMGLTTLSVVTPAEFAAAWGDRGPDPAGRTQYMAALGLRVRSLDMTRGALSKGGIPASTEAHRISVAARDAFGVALDFRE